MLIDRQKVKEIRKQYPAGTRIRLEKLNDPYRKMERGLLGEVKRVDDLGQIHMIWENGSTLALVPAVDEFIIV